jgi:hypothetical protein
MADELSQRLRNFRSRIVLTLFLLTTFMAGLVAMWLGIGAAQGLTFGSHLLWPF